MTVWIVFEEILWEGRDVVGVHATEVGAKAEAQRMLDRNVRSDIGYPISSYEVTE